jgi:hypothetical protein
MVFSALPISNIAENSFSNYNGAYIPMYKLWCIQWIVDFKDYVGDIDIKSSSSIIMGKGKNEAYKNVL